MNQIIIGVSKGVAYLISSLESVEVVIRDYDVDGVDDSVLRQDSDGDFYQEIVLQEVEDEKSLS